MRYLGRLICVDMRGLNDNRAYRAISKWIRMIEPAGNVRTLVVDQESRISGLHGGRP